MKTLIILCVAGFLTSLSLLAGAPADDHKGIPHAWLASNLIGMTVYSPQGESLGEIEDVIVNSTGEASYAVLDFGSWCSSNDELFALPWSALHTTTPEANRKGNRYPDREQDDDKAHDRLGDRVGEAERRDRSEGESTRLLVLSMTTDQLQSAPGFDGDSWPNTESVEWSKSVDEFYAREHRNTRDTRVAKDGMTPGSTAVTRGKTYSWRASKLTGTAITTPTGESLGSVEQIAIDTNGRVSFVTMSSGGVLGIGARSIAVPWDALTFSAGKERGDASLITLATTSKQIEQAPEFKHDGEHASEMCDPAWVVRVYGHFSTPTYWNADRKVVGQQSTGL